MSIQQPTTKSINSLNRAFWADQRSVIDAFLQDDIIRAQALAELDDEEVRRVPLLHRRTLEACLYAIAKPVAATREKVVRERAVKAAQAPRTDSLQKVIAAYVEIHHDAGWKEVLRFLEGEKGKRVVAEITDDAIWFETGSGRKKSATISGLKDRVRRAR